MRFATNALPVKDSFLEPWCFSFLSRMYPKGYPDGVVTSPSLSQSRPKESPQDGLLPRSKVLFQGCHIHFLQTGFQSRSNAESVQCLNSFIHISLVCLQDHAHVINSKFLEAYLKSENIEFKCEVFGSLLSFLRFTLDLKTWQMGDLIELKSARCSDLPSHCSSGRISQEAIFSVHKGQCTSNLAGFQVLLNSRW